MKHQLWFGPTYETGHAQRISQLGASHDHLLASVHHLAAKQVQHYFWVQPAFIDKGNVGHWCESR